MNQSPFDTFTEHGALVGSQRTKSKIDDNSGLKHDSTEETIVESDYWEKKDVDVKSNFYSVS